MSADLRSAPPDGAMADAGVSDPVASPRSSGELFLTFAWISMQSFGGALAFIERTIVRDRRWLSPKEFLGLYAMSQALPGPTGISFCMLLGDRFLGVRGALSAVAGFLLLPGAVVIAIAALFQQYQHVPQVQGALHGMGAAAVGLIVTTAARMARTLRGQRLGVAVAVLSFCAVGLARLPVRTVMLTLGAASVWLAWRREPR
jgi:chromate transporter